MTQQEEKIQPTTDEAIAAPEATADTETAPEMPDQEEQQPSVDALQQQVQTLQQELAESKDQLLRIAAEAQNVRRRAEADVEKAHKFALEKFARDLLPVVDSLEKATQSMASLDTAQKEGVEMTLKLLLNTLERFQIRPVHPLGELFNPQLHEAMTLVPNPELPANSVMDVLQTGYTLNDRLLRPAMVVVSTGGETKKIDENA